MPFLPRGPGRGTHLAASNAARVVTDRKEDGWPHGAGRRRAVGAGLWAKFQRTHW